MEFQKEYLDVVLVPGGLLIMFVYHLFLLYKYFHHRLSTSMGYENNDKRNWVGKILQSEDVKQNVSSGLVVISSNISAAMYLATISLTLCSLIGTWMASSSNNFFPREMIYGNTAPETISIKYMCLLICFLLAFSCFVQSARHFVHSSYLLSTPGATANLDVIYVKKVERALQRGSEFWSLGLRALYFALDLLLWFFGPIPMFVSSIIMLMILYCHDFKSESDDQKGAGE